MFPRYKYQMNAAQLCFLCECIEKTRSLPGRIMEIGCASGETTVFLNNYLDARGIQKQYQCIDTFSGFVDADIAYEISHRDRISYEKTYRNAFSLNKKKWFERTMRQNGIERVIVTEADINNFDFSTISQIAFCLLDVDLYRPIKHALPYLYERLSPSGIIVVDDCDKNAKVWDGADQAYKEFVRENLLETKIVHKKLGVIEKAL